MIEGAFYLWKIASMSLSGIFKFCFQTCNRKQLCRTAGSEAASGSLRDAAPEGPGISPGPPGTGGLSASQEPGVGVRGVGAPAPGLREPCPPRARLGRETCWRRGRGRGRLRAAPGRAALSRFRRALRPPRPALPARAAPPVGEGAARPRGRAAGGGGGGSRQD